MANGKLNSWADVQALLSANSGNVSSAPHQAFWNNLTYDQFVNHCVPDPNGQAGCVTNQGPPPPPTGAPVQILIKGNSKQSNIILALSGMLPFDGSVFNQMPDGGPYWTPKMVNELADWIDAGCHEYASTETDEE